MRILGSGERHLWLTNPLRRRFSRHRFTRRSFASKKVAVIALAEGAGTWVDLEGEGDEFTSSVLTNKQEKGSVWIACAIELEKEEDDDDHVEKVSTFKSRSHELRRRVSDTTTSSADTLLVKVSDFNSVAFSNAVCGPSHATRYGRRRNRRLRKMSRRRTLAPFPPLWLLQYQHQPPNINPMRAPSTFSCTRPFKCPRSPPGSRTTLLSSLLGRNRRRARDLACWPGITTSIPFGTSTSNWKG